MAKAMTTHERFTRMFAHQDADRIPIVDSPWHSTIARWQREGMPKDVHFTDYFDIDRTVMISADNSPRFEEKVISDTPESKTFTTKWGVTQRDWKYEVSTPEFLSHTIVDPESWAKAKARINANRDRINWDHLKENYPEWRKKGYWIQGLLWFGFDVTHSHTVGTERVLMALVENPEWMQDMFSTMLEASIQLLDQIWDAGYHFDSAFWYDDMGYKNNQFFSVNMYRELLKPYHKRAIDWAHAKGIKAHLHSCGDVRPFVPELVGIGLDALNPLEVKAGMDPAVLKKQFGKDLVFHGGLNAVLWDKPDQIQAEMRKVVPIMKEHGGYICSSDHSVPSSVSLQDFRQITDLAKELGKY